MDPIEEPLQIHIDHHPAAALHVTQGFVHASSPRSVTLTQLRFTSFAVINLQRDSHPQECAHAGRTNKKASPKAGRSEAAPLTSGKEPRPRASWLPPG